MSIKAWINYDVPQCCLFKLSYGHNLQQYNTDWQVHVKNLSSPAWQFEPPLMRILGVNMHCESWISAFPKLCTDFANINFYDEFKYTISTEITNLMRKIKFLSTKFRDFPLHANYPKRQKCVSQEACLHPEY